MWFMHREIAAVATYNACSACLTASMKLSGNDLSKLILGQAMYTNAEVAAINTVNRSQPSNALPVDSGNSSPVCWAAIFAGAIAAAALSLIMLILGTGLGLSSVSPWALSGISASTFGISAIAWITLTQLLASGMGGYLAGRLRTSWLAVHNDEVYFRDTAHGFLAWAVASLVTAAVLASATGAIVGSGVQAGAAVAGTAAAGAVGAATAAATSGADRPGMSAADAGNYFIDSLFRKDITPATAVVQVGANGPDSTSPAAVAEVSRIFINSLRTGALPPEDLRYVSQVVAQRTSLSPADAEKRVTQAYTRMQTKLREAETAARDTADKTRKASAYAALWIFISLLFGAFVASLAATFGGRQRDSSNQYSSNL